MPVAAPPAPIAADTASTERPAVTLDGPAETRWRRVSGDRPPILPRPDHPFALAAALRSERHSTHQCQLRELVPAAAGGPEVNVRAGGAQLEVITTPEESRAGPRKPDAAALQGARSPTGAPYRGDALAGERQRCGYRERPAPTSECRHPTLTLMRARGFTLIELVITLAIVGLLATAAMPLASWSPGARRRPSCARRYVKFAAASMPTGRRRNRAHQAGAGGLRLPAGPQVALRGRRGRRERKQSEALLPAAHPP